MLSNIFKKHPLDTLDKEVDEILRLIGLLEEAMILRMGPTKADLEIDRLKYETQTFGNLLLRAKRARKTLGRDGPPLTIKMTQTLEDMGLSFGFILYPYRGKPRGEDPRMNDILNEFLESMNRIGKYIKLLSMHIAERIETLVLERHPEYEPARRIRREILKIDKDLAKGVILEKLLNWYNRFYFMKTDDKLRYDKMALVYVLEMIPFQEWELRYRSHKPGRQLVILETYTEFPELDDINSYNRTYGHHDEYVVAAKKPHWRKIWVYKVS